jgi:predicted transcriptional regulator
VGRTKNETTLLARRRAAVADLYIQGCYQADIAQQLGVSQPTVSNDIKAIQKEWRASAIRDFDILRERELQKLDRLEREAWEAWERSQKPAQEATMSTDGTAQKTVKKVSEQSGDARYLEVVHKCIASRRALLGIDAPVKVAPTSPDGEQAYHSFVMAELMRLSEQAKAGPEVIDAAFIERASQSPPSEQTEAVEDGLHAPMENVVQQTNAA